MIVTKYLPMLFSLLAFSVDAGEGAGAGFSMDLEPCINGAVSESGAYPSQEMEDQIRAYLAWRKEIGNPFYMFRTSVDRPFGAYSER